MIREICDTDIDAVLLIWLEASVLAHDFVGREFWESKLELMRSTYLPMAQTYVYEEAGQVLGFLSLYENNIAALFVKPENQGNGIGQALMAKAKELRTELELSVYKANKRSINFYQKSGFKIIKEQIDEHTGHAELVMTFKNLKEN